MKYKLGYRPEPPDEQDLCLSIPQYDLPKKVDWTVAKFIFHSITSYRIYGVTSLKSAASNEIVALARFKAVILCTRKY
ncbi:hypothetical protein ES703_73265 [subsurface metagenome]